MERHIRHHAPQPPRQTHVLQYEGIHTAFCRFDGGIHGGIQFLLPYQSVQGEVHRHPAGTTKSHRLFQRFGGEIMGTAAGIKLLHT